MSALEEGFDGELEVRHDGGATATDIVVIKKEVVGFKGLAGLYTKISYKEAATGIIWIDEEIAVRTPEEIIYGFELKCRPEELTALEPIFNSITFDTFKFSCPRKYLH